METADLNIRQTSTEEAESTVQTSGSGRSSKYENVAQAWEQAQAEGEAVVLEDVTENDVQNIRNLIYRRFDKEGVIVRSSKQGEDSFNVAIREREDGEYLRDEDSGEESEAEATEEDTEADEETDEEEEEEFSPSFE